MFICKKNWLVLCLLGVLLSGCPGDQQSAEKEKSGADSPQSSQVQKLKLAFVTNNTSDFWTIARKGVEDAVSELENVEYDFRLPADGSAATQKQLLDDLLVKGFDGIALSPVDPVNQTPMLRQVAAETLLVTQDSDAPESGRVCYVGSDNTAAGKMAGETILKALPDGGEIMLFVGMKDAQNARERIAGIESVLAGSDITIVDIRTDDTDRTRAKGNVSDALVSNPELDALVGLWSYNGPAILNAVVEAGNDKIKIIAFDEEEETLEGVKKGQIFATVIQQPYEFGRESMRLMAALLRGDETVLPENGQLIIPTRVIDQTNIDEFLAWMDKIRGRVSE